MALAADQEFPATGSDPKAMLHVPIGAASPLWALFAGAAVTGATWWWMYRWTRPENLEAMFAKTEAVGPLQLELMAPAGLEAVEETLQAMAVATTETLEAAVETVETAAEAINEAAEPAWDGAVDPIEAVVAAPEPETPPVGGESAPIAPAVAMTAKPQRKTSPPDPA